MTTPDQTPNDDATWDAYHRLYATGPWKDQRTADENARHAFRLSHVMNDPGFAALRAAVYPCRFRGSILAHAHARVHLAKVIKANTTAAAALIEFLMP